MSKFPMISCSIDSAIQPIFVNWMVHLLKQYLVGHFLKVSGIVSPGQFSDSDKKTAENFGCDYMDVNEFVKSMN